MEPIVQEILNLVRKKMKEQGAYDRDAFADYVDETIDYFKEKGKISDDDSEAFIKEQLLNEWDNVEEKLTENDY